MQEQLPRTGFAIFSRRGRYDVAGYANTNSRSANEFRRGVAVNQRHLMSPALLAFDRPRTSPAGTHRVAISNNLRAHAVALTPYRQSIAGAIHCNLGR